MGPDLCCGCEVSVFLWLLCSSVSCPVNDIDIFELYNKLPYFSCELGCSWLSVAGPGRLSVPGGIGTLLLCPNPTCGKALCGLRGLWLWQCCDGKGYRVEQCSNTAVPECGHADWSPAVPVLTVL